TAPSLHWPYNRTENSWPADSSRRWTDYFVVESPALVATDALTRPFIQSRTTTSTQCWYNLTASSYWAEHLPMSAGTSAAGWLASAQTEAWIWTSILRLTAASPRSCCSQTACSLLAVDSVRSRATRAAALRD